MTEKETGLQESAHALEFRRPHPVLLRIDRESLVLYLRLLSVRRGYVHPPHGLRLPTLTVDLESGVELTRCVPRIVRVNGTINRRGQEQVEIVSLHLHDEEFSHVPQVPEREALV